VHGACPDGADAVADAWTLASLPRPPERWPAPWAQLGRAAGPRRNQAMVDSRPDEAHAFLREPPVSRGTRYCVDAAERAGIPTYRHIYGRPDAAPTLPRQQPDAAPTPRVLRSGVELAHDDPSLPTSVRALLPSCPPGARLTAAVAHDDAGVLASLALRVPGVGWGVWRRREGGSWGFADGALLLPHLRRANAGQLTAALRGEAYLPPAPRPPALKTACPGCGAEVSTTKDGKIYKSHRCMTGGTFRQRVEGRS
jgi:hypothetical protein